MSWDGLGEYSKNSWERDAARQERENKEKLDSYASKSTPKPSYTHSKSPSTDIDSLEMAIQGVIPP